MEVCEDQLPVTVSYDFPLGSIFNLDKVVKPFAMEANMQAQVL